MLGDAGTARGSEHGCGRGDVHRVGAVATCANNVEEWARHGHWDAVLEHHACQRRHLGSRLALCAQQHEEMQAQAEAKAATAKRNWDDIANSIS